TRSSCRQRRAMPHAVYRTRANRPGILPGRFAADIDLKIQTLVGRVSFNFGWHAGKRPKRHLERSNPMIRIVAVLGFFLVTTNSSSAQTDAQCAQIRQAVATYGYTAARRHALAHYGPQAVAYGDRCLRGGHTRRLRRR